MKVFYALLMALITFVIGLIPMLMGAPVAAGMVAAAIGGVFAAGSYWFGASVEGGYSFDKQSWIAMAIQAVGIILGVAVVGGIFLFPGV